MPDPVRVVGGERGADDRAVAVAEVVEPILAERNADRLEVGGRVGPDRNAASSPVPRAQSSMNSGLVEIGVGTAVDRRGRRADPARVPAHDVVGAQDVGRHAGPDPPRRVETRPARAAGVHHERPPARAGGRMAGQRERDRRRSAAGSKGSIGTSSVEHSQRDVPRSVGDGMPKVVHGPHGSVDGSIEDRPVTRSATGGRIGGRIGGGAGRTDRCRTPSVGVGVAGSALGSAIGVRARSSTATSTPGEHAARSDPAMTRRTNHRPGVERNRTSKVWSIKRC